MAGEGNRGNTGAEDSMKLSEAERATLAQACREHGHSNVKCDTGLSGLQLASALSSGRLPTGRVAVAKVREYLKRAHEFIHFGDVARDRCHEQCQYASRYVDGRHDCPHLGEGLRFSGDPKDYHSLLIHRDDADEFVRRFLEYRRAIGAIA